MKRFLIELAAGMALAVLVIVCLGGGCYLIAHMTR